VSRPVIVSVLVAALAVAAGAPAPTPATASPAAQRDAAVTLRVMTFNIFYGGDELNLRTHDWCVRRPGCKATLRKVVAAIRASGADVVGLQEPAMNTATIAAALGWHANPRTSIISRYPLIDPSGGGGEYVYAELGRGRVVALANTHLPSDPYGPYAARDGASRAELLALERRVRLPFLRPHLRALRRLVAAGVPTFLTGDFNSPSHLDWTAAVARKRAVVRFPLAWPVGRALARIGMRDSYREAHPDPVAAPGYTWTPGGLESVPREVHDRIDWVLAGGPARTLRSQVVGEPGPGRIVFRPWPSDHRGVVSTFRVRPASPPTFVAPRARRARIGAQLRVRFHRAAGAVSARIALVPAGRGPGAALRWRATGSRRDGVVALRTAGLAPRAHDVLLVDADGRVRARARVWLHRAGARPSVSTGERVYASGEPIAVRWRNAPGMHWDWLGLYRAGSGGELIPGPPCMADVCGNGDYLAYEYTDTAPAGATTFDGGSAGIAWPLRPGRYEIRLLLDDAYWAVARSRPFRVRAP
jgi:endonuclease/exonuclease/phosphatase family metal-dependent hydrolase